MTIQEISGGVTAAKGFLAGAVHAGVKSSNKTKKDVAVIYSETPAYVSGVFTQNKFAAAPVAWCRSIVANGKAQAVVVNSGNANACTGAEGAANTEKMASLTAQALHIACLLYTSDAADEL